ncbi:MAG: metallophosphoesterase family protein [Pseudomonadota bacterium]
MPSTGGPRIYAIGDVHGCLDDLNEMLARIDADLAAHPHGDARLVFIGDYVDRGPNSRGVIDRLLELEAGPWNTTFLKGNHDERFARYLAQPEDRATSKYHWLSDPIGGGKTLESYGVTGSTSQDPLATHAPALAAVPAAHRAFLDRLKLTERVGDYLFVHAGIRPGVALEDQVEHDLIWIREEFLTDTRDHGMVVVFGHTFMPQITATTNWIGIDTGCVFEGVLSCLVLEDEARWDLLPKGRAEIEIEPHPTKRPERALFSRLLRS